MALERLTMASNAFYDCFSSYAVAVGQLWSSITTSTAPRAGERFSADLKLLVLHSNCVHTRTHILRELSNRSGTAFKGMSMPLSWLGKLVGWGGFDLEKHGLEAGGMDRAGSDG